MNDPDLTPAEEPETQGQQPDYTRPLTDREPTSFEHAAFAVLQGKHVYQGSVPAADIAARRDRNRAARKARRRNRAVAR